MKQLEMSNGDVRDVCDHEWRAVYSVGTEEPQYWFCANCPERRHDDPTA